MTPEQEALFDQKYIRGDGCWLWTASLMNTGYGQFGWQVDGKTKNFLAHRLMYEREKGPIPDGLDVRHTCDVRSCVNPDHLLVGTRKQNMEDAVRRGRMHRGERTGGSKLTEDDVLTMRWRRSKGDTYRSLATHFGVTPSTARAACLRHTWRHI